MIYIQILFSGIIAGIIIFHTSVVAPLVFKKLEAPFISNLLRALFPKFFIMIFVLSLANFIMSYDFKMLRIKYAVSCIISSGTHVLSFNWNYQQGNGFWG